MRDKRGKTSLPGLERAKVRNGKVSFQAAINRRGASHLTTRADRMRERRGPILASRTELPHRSLACNSRTYIFWGVLAKNTNIPLWHSNKTRSFCLWACTRCVRERARAATSSTSSPSRWLHQNAWMVLEIEMGTKRQGVYDRTHTNRYQTAGNALTNVVPPSSAASHRVEGTSYSPANSFPLFYRFYYAIFFSRHSSLFSKGIAAI